MFIFFVDEMGLGKTIQTIAMLAHLATYKGRLAYDIDKSVFEKSLVRSFFFSLFFVFRYLGSSFDRGTYELHRELGS